MTEVYTVVGPPGTGKTSYVARQCRNAVAAYGSAGVVVCSLTRAAAREAAGRDTGVEPENVGTLHALCYRALGRPKLAVGPLVKAWNEEHPDLALTVGASGSLDETAGAPEVKSGGAGRSGDELCALMDVLRARRAPRGEWPQDVLHFADAWDAFKADSGALDFTDLIERAVEDLPFAPGRPDALFVDEAQDLSRLELDLVTRWAEHARSVVVVGDPWQAIYSWRGSSPDVLAATPHKLLADSYRVPRSVHEVALGLMRRSGDWREDVVYRPRGAEGEVVRWPASPSDGTTWQDPRAVVELAERAFASGPAVVEGEGGARRQIPALMVLASCDYMLGPVKRMLREAAVPYGNPFTHRWNPLSPEALARARAVLNPVRDEIGGPPSDSPYLWTVQQVRQWAPCFRVDSGDGADDGVFLRGRRVTLENLPEGLTPQEVSAAISAACTPEAIRALANGDAEWLAERVTRANASLAFALRCAARHGWRALAGDMPPVVLSTIHGAKGGEAHRVVLFPDLAPSAWRQLAQAGWDARDAIFRQFYVGATRARESLVLAARSSRLAMAV